MSELRTSKRKRNQVSYYEATELENDEQANMDDEDYSQTKKCKKCQSKKAKGKKSKFFPFLELPPELRNKIYGYCLLDPDDMLVMSKTKNYRRTVVRMDSRTFHTSFSLDPRVDHGIYKRKEPRQELRPAILAVCNQIYEEGSPFLYGQTINIDDTMTLHAFIACTSHRNRLLLRKIVVHSWGFGRGTHKAMNHSALTLLATCINLDRVIFACPIHWNFYDKSGTAAKFIARQLYRDGFHFLETIGAARNNQDAGIDVVDIHDDNFSVIPIPRGLSSGRPDEKMQQEAMETNRRMFRDELKKLLRS